MDTVAKELMEYSLNVHVRTGTTPDFIGEEVTRLKKRIAVDLVIADHMQLMSCSGSVKGDYEKFTTISRHQKIVAKEVGVPFLVVSQTSRNNATDKRTELEVTDLRGSGAIEEDAAAVMLVYPDKQDMADQLLARTFHVGPVKSWLKLGKNRYGPGGVYLPLNHHKTCTRFDLMEGDAA